MLHTVVWALSTWLLYSASYFERAQATLSTASSWSRIAAFLLCSLSNTGCQATATSIQVLIFGSIGQKAEVSIAPHLAVTIGQQPASSRPYSAKLHDLTEPFRCRPAVFIRHGDGHHILASPAGAAVLSPGRRSTRFGSCRSHASLCSLRS